MGLRLFLHLKDCFVVIGRQSDLVDTPGEQFVKRFTLQWLSQSLRAKPRGLPRHAVFHCQKAWWLKAAWAHSGVLFHPRFSFSWYQSVKVVRGRFLNLC